MRGDPESDVKPDFTVFAADREKTQHYYQIHELCDCAYCRNLYAQIQAAAPQLAVFLESLGADITRPDECGAIENKNQISYLYVDYTVTGELKAAEPIDMSMDGLRIFALAGCDKQAGTSDEQAEPYFIVTVMGLSLPWILEEPLPSREKLADKLKRLFKRS